MLIKLFVNILSLLISLYLLFNPSQVYSKSFFACDDSIQCQQIRSFMEEELECERYVFSTGEFPKIKWKNEFNVDGLMGKFTLNIKYFNGDFQQTNRADKPGRYGAVIEGITPKGFNIRRYVTLYCANIEFDDYSDNVPIKMNQLSEYGIDEEKWAKYSKNEEHFSFGSFKFFPKNNADAAIFLAGLNDMNDLTNNYDTPRIRDRQWWITMKKKLEGYQITQNPLQFPQRINDDALIYLNDSVVYTMEYDSKQIENLREICRTWSEKGEVAHVTMVVHKGKIIFYESFGNDESGKPITKNARIWMASITKLLSGVLMMQFVEQGIIDLDAPVSHYLSELKGTSGDKLIIRHLFTHTSGLHFSGEWASDWNYALENQIAHVLPSVDIGKSFSYHRVGYALAGKIMEWITGLAVPYLFQDYLFSPLGMKSAYSDNTYGGLYCTTIDLAHLGQLLLNNGAYNGYKFFSKKSYKKMLPKKLPFANSSWGIGTSPRNDHGLSELAFGHGAASGTVFCIDPKNDLIIISARNKPGRMHSEFESLLIESCTAIVKNH